MCYAYKLNKQGDNIQPWRTPFPIWNQSVLPCPVLTVASWPAYRFLKRQVRWSGIPISFRIFSSFLWSTQPKFSMVNKAEEDIFLELSCFFNDPMNVGNLISCSSSFSKTRLNIRKFTVHVLLKPGLENFEHYFTNVWDECNCYTHTHTHTHTYISQPPWVTLWLPTPSYPSRSSQAPGWAPRVIYQLPTSHQFYTW